MEASYRDIVFSYNSEEKPKLKIGDDIVYFAYNRGYIITGLAQAKEKHPITWWQDKIGHPDVVIKSMQVIDLCHEISLHILDDDSQFFEDGNPNYATEFREEMNEKIPLDRFLHKKKLSSNSKEAKLLHDYQDFINS